MSRPTAFVTYARADSDVVDDLVTLLKTNEVEVWIDRRDIPGGADWLQEIFHGIESSDVYLFVVSPSSVVSPYCMAELRHAARSGKRIVPLMIEAVDPEALPPELTSRQCLDLRPDPPVAELLSAIRTDLDWIRLHTRLLERSSQWEQTGRDRSRLLTGQILGESEKWRDDAPPHSDVRPTTQQLDFLHESRRREDSDRAHTDVLHGLTLLDSGVPGRAEDYIARARAALGAMGEDDVMARVALWSVVRTSSRPIAHLLSGLARIVHVDWAFDGEAVLAVDRKGRACLWDGLSGKHRGEWQLPVEFVADAAVSADGAHLAIGGQDGTLLLWDLRQGVSLGSRTTAHADVVSAVTFSDDGGTLVSGSYDMTAVAWSVPDLRPVRRLVGHRSPIMAVAVSHDGAVVVTGGSGTGVIPGEGFNIAQTGHDATLRSWDVASGYESAHSDMTGWVHAIRLLDDDCTAFVSISDGFEGRRLDVVDVRAGCETTAEVGYEHPVRSIRSTPSGEHILFDTASDTHSAAVWDSRRSHIVSYLHHAAAVSATAISCDGKVALTGTDEGEVQLWNTREHRCVRSHDSGARTVGGLAIVPGVGVVAGSGIRTIDLGSTWWQDQVTQQTADHPLTVWDPGTGLWLATRRAGLAAVSGIDAVAGSTTVLCRTVGGEFVFVVTGTDDRPPDRMPAPRSVTHLAVTFDARFAVVAGSTGERTSDDAGRVLIIDLADGSTRYEFDSHAARVRSARPMPGGRVVSIDDTGAILVWSWDEPGDVLRAVHPDAAGPTLAVSPDGSSLVVGGDDGVVRRWRIADLSAAPTIMLGHAAGVIDSVLSTAGGVAATVSYDGTLRVFHTETGRQLASVREHRLTPRHVRFAVNDGVIVTGGDDGRIVVHDLGFANQLSDEEERYLAATRRLLAAPDDVDAHVATARWFGFRGEWGRALDAFQEALRSTEQQADLLAAAGADAAVWALLADMPLVGYTMLERVPPPLDDIRGELARRRVIHEGVGEFVRTFDKPIVEQDALDLVARFPALVAAHGYDGRTAIHAAAQHGDEATVAVLLGHGANVDARRTGDSQVTPLHFAILRGRSSMVEFLIRSGADPDAADGYGWTPLHHAASIDGLPALRILIERGADRERATPEGHRALHVAAGLDRTAAADVLLAAGADVSARDGRGGATPLHFAVGNGASHATVRVLLDAGAPVDVRTDNGETALDLAHRVGNATAAEAITRHPER